MSEKASSDVVVQVEPAALIISPYALAKSAEHFFEMATAYSANGSARAARLYIYCVAIELGLKAGIRAKDWSKENRERVRRKIGHNLTEAARECEEIYGVLLSEEARATIDEINPYFKRKELEYFEPAMMELMLRGYSGLPSFEAMRDAASEVISFLRNQEFFINTCAR